MALFTIKVEDDRVKVKGAAGDAIGKVKRKDAAFKVYGRDDKVLFKAKRKKDKIKIKGDDGQELGKIKKSTMTWKGQSITSRPDGGKVTIEGPSGPLRVVGVNPDEALWLGIPDLDLSLRLGVVIFLRDIGF